MSDVHQLTVPPEADGRRLDDFLRSRGVSRRLMIRLKRTENGMTRSGSLIRSCDIVRSGDIIILNEGTGQTECKKSSVPHIYEDSDIIIYDKPQGMAVHRSMGIHSGTLQDIFLGEYEGAVFRPVSRLDKNTSGLCICAKSAFGANLPAKSCTKLYYAIVCGSIAAPGRIELPIGRAEGSVIKRTVRPDGKPAVTYYEPVKAGEKYTLLRIWLESGRTHQIRVHLSHIGFPLAGDDLYGGSTEDIKRHALHCGYIKIQLPDRIAEAESALPRDMRELIDRI